ncbi:MAG: ABC transporter permease [Candidatus Aminicenantes bacterium]|nr:ABC transporter permease [Candidatus Aminicenantes bacterium]
MKRILIIFKKELKDTLRDRRTVMMMVVFPLVLIYVLMSLTFSLSRSQTRKAEEKVITVGLITTGNAGVFRGKLAKSKNVVIKEDIAVAKISELIQAKTLDFAVVFEEGFDRKVQEKGSGDVQLYYKASNENSIAKKRIDAVFNEYKEELLNARLAELKLDRAFVEPVKVNINDLSTAKEKIGESIGGLLPYFFILFCFLGAMYPAIDLAAGEKERATIETLLTSPASRLQIVIGKFMVVTLAGIFSAMVAILALYMSLRGAKEIPPEMFDALFRIIEYRSIGMLLSLLVPLCVFFAALLLSVSIYARSFKEAQSMVTPLNILVIVPVLIGLFPGIKLTAVTALIPVLNVSLATKEIISGTIQTGLLIEVYVSLFVLAAAGLYFCAQWFKREEVIFRGI